MVKKKSIVSQTQTAYHPLQPFILIYPHIYTKTHTQDIHPKKYDLHSILSPRKPRFTLYCRKLVAFSVPKLHQRK
jgi:hypothetical protein